MTSTTPIHSRRFFIVPLACALLAPAAATAQPVDHGRAITAPAARQDLRSPDARDAAAGGYLGQGVQQDLRSPDTRDAARPVQPVSAAPARPVSDPGVDWPSAAIGAALLGGAGIATAAGVGATRRRRTRVPA